ncbi:hypothetical protein HanRHA438_Chr14g0656851 [Helianthus annuus]|nr:hypothetical protein HanRHA438_Chr14g0656851 [Helianthus annuus]
MILNGLFLWPSKALVLWVRSVVMVWWWMTAPPRVMSVVGWYDWGSRVARATSDT